MSISVNVCVWRGFTETLEVFSRQTLRFDVP